MQREFFSNEYFVKKRQIKQTPFKVLDAPSLLDDYYMNVLDWSINDNLSVALGNCLYLWNYNTSELKKLKSYGTNNVPTSLAFDLYSEALVVGSKSGQVEVIDVATNKEI